MGVSQSHLSIQQTQCTSPLTECITTNIISDISTNMQNNGTANKTSDVIPILWLGTPIFPAIHLTAVIACVFSTVLSCVIVTIVLKGMTRGFFAAKVGERLVIYLALADLGFSTSHGADHVVYYVTETHTPEPGCTIIALTCGMAIFSQSLVVNIAAVAAVVMVVRERRVNFGRYDWKLWAYAFGAPAVLFGSLAALGYLGATPTWCFIDLRSRVGMALNSFLLVTLVTEFGINCVCYVMVWLKINRVSGLLNAASSGTNEAQVQAAQRSRRSAQSMVLIVLAFCVQWSPYVVYTVWDFLPHTPPIEMLICVVALSNLGGAFNAVAYTLMRRKFAHNDARRVGKRNHVSNTA